MFLNIKYIHIQTIILCFKNIYKILNFSFYIFIYIADILLYNKINSFINLRFTHGSPAVDPVTQQPVSHPVQCPDRV